MSNRRAQHVIVITLLLSLTSCSVSTAAPADDPAGSVGASSLPACAGVGPTINLPPDFPAAFPLPPGTAIQSSRSTSEGVLVVHSIVPAELKAAAAFFLRELPAAGFTLGMGDGELDEAESTFSGNGYQGHFKVHSIQDCPGAVTLSVVLAKQ